MKENPVGWFEIYVEDMGRARKFYETVLGASLEQLPMPEDLDDPSMQMLAFPMSMDKPGAAGALVKMQGFPAGCGGTLVYFSCEDCAIEAGRVVSAGGRLEHEKQSIGQYGFIAHAFDTEGNMFGLHSQS